MSIVDIMIVAESHSDTRIATFLADRILMIQLGWPDKSMLPGLRRWRGEAENSEFLDIHKVHELARAKGIPPVYGHFDNRPTAPDYQSAMDALYLALASEPQPHAFVWIRDTDGDKSRVQGWRDASQQFTHDFAALVSGFPHECMETWRLLAWSHGQSRDDVRVAQERQRLGFDPTTSPERLSHKQNVPKSAKAVVEALGAHEYSLHECDLEATSRGGSACGLATYLDEVRKHLLPAVRRGPE
jgi:hypothetical protein